jgi:hypothetical protein
MVFLFFFWFFLEELLVATMRQKIAQGLRIGYRKMVYFIYRIKDFFFLIKFTHDFT